MDIIEHDLYKHGFTDQEVDNIKKTLLSPERKDKSLMSIMIELKRRFYMACSLIITLFFFTGYASYHSQNEYVFIYYIVTIPFYLFIVRFTPLKTAWKARNFMRKRKGH